MYEHCALLGEKGFLKNLNKTKARPYFIVYHLHNDVDMLFIMILKYPLIKYELFPGLRFLTF